MASLFDLFKSREQRQAAMASAQKKKKKVVKKKKSKLGDVGLGSTIRKVRSRNERLKNI